MHRATSKSPYEVVFGILPQQQTINQTATIATATSTASCTATAVAEHINLEDVTVEDDEEETNYEEEASSSSHKRKAPEDDLVSRKATRIATNEKQKQYNEKMKLSRKKSNMFDIDDYVSVKIDPVDKASPLHPNVLFGKVISVESNNYVRIATKYRKISTPISPARLLKCSKPNMQFDTTKDITFTKACKMAHNQ